MNLSIGDITGYLDGQKLNYQYSGKQSLLVSGFCSLSNLKRNSVTWIKKLCNFDIGSMDKSLDLLIITDNAGTDESSTNGYNVITCGNPKQLFFSILARFFAEPQKAAISPASTVETREIGSNVSIGHNCFICKDVVIGNNVIIRNNVVIECKTVIGENTVIGSGVVIGTDGFGYYKDGQGINRKVPHFGGVLIGRDVEIGANTCIDRGTLDDTVIEDNVKIDNLCHIAHNVHIKENVFVIALSMIAGSAVLEKNAYIAPGALVINQATVGENSLVGMGAVVVKSVEAGKVVAGVPARVLRDNTEGNK
jgi:UDP-3-O-[3-hydroxymyristoyl] glucosamine N-acyltransferase LpxD